MPAAKICKGNADGGSIETKERVDREKIRLYTNGRLL